MSEEENSSESVNSTNQAAETEDKASNSEAASSAVSNIIAKAMELKESNPKVFFGALGGVVLLIIIMMMSGGGESVNKHLPVATMTNLTIGQTYSLKSVNTYDPEATVRLVAVPGSMAAYDDTEEADRKGDCKHMPQGTKVKLVQVQDSAGARFAQVEIIGGECAGKKAWAISNNLK